MSSGRASRVGDGADGMASGVIHGRAHLSLHLPLPRNAHKHTKACTSAWKQAV